MSHSLSSSQTQALGLLKSLLSECPAEVQTLPHSADRQKFARLFELCAAFELDMLLWESLPPAAFDARPVPLRRFMARGGRPRDYGIDCASPDLSRAAQAKWYQNGSGVRWRDISTFHSLGAAARIGELTLVTSVGVGVVSLVDALPIQRLVIPDERIDAICAMALKPSCAPVLLDSEVEEIFANLGLSEPLSAGGREPRQESHTPPRRPQKYAWQADAILCLSESLTHPNNAPVVASIVCGAGKSRVIIELAKRNKFFPCVVLVPAVALLEQFKNEVRNWAPEASVGLVGGGSTGDVAGCDFVISTYNSSSALQSLPFRLCVVDEAHHAFEEFQEAGGEEGHDRVFATTMRNLNYEKALLMSATLPVEDLECQYSYGIGEAVRDGTIVDYHIVIPYFPRGTTSGGLCALIREHPEWTRVLAYCNSVASAVSFAAILTEKGVPAATFCGKTPMHVREENMRRLAAGEIRVLATVHTIGEGVNLPEADTCLFVEPRGSQVDVAQCVGRVLRTSQATGKSVAHVILPTADEGKELERFLRLMAKADLRLSKSGWRRRVSVFIAGAGENKNEEEETAEEDEATIVKVYDRAGLLLGENSAWETKIALLKEYISEFGRLPPANENGIYRNINLGQWVATQRRAYKGIKGIMSPTRQTTLEALPGWYWDYANVRDDKWDQNYKLLEQFVQETGELPPKFGGKKGFVYQGVNLGEWMAGQICAEKGIGTRAMTPDRKRQLEQIPGWKWREKGKNELEAENWQKKLNLLKKFVDNHGRLPTRKDDPYEETNLSAWIATMRGAKRGTATVVLTPDREKALEAIPHWCWVADPDAGWNIKYHLCLDYVREYGRVPTVRTHYKGENLGAWVANQRSAKRGTSRTPLSPGREEKLKAIPGWVW